MDTQFPDSQSVLGNASSWLHRQLESELQKLVTAVNMLAYTRNPVAMSAAAEQCARVEAVLVECEQREPGSENSHCIDNLLLIETHQMLAEARRLVSAPLEPVWRDDNIIELKPNYADLTDAAFERMLASSDIPQLLSSPSVSWTEVEGPPDSDVQPQPSVAGKPRLRLVYSGDREDS